MHVICQGSGKALYTFRFPVFASRGLYDPIISFDPSNNSAGDNGAGDNGAGDNAAVMIGAGAAALVVVAAGAAAYMYSRKQAAANGQGHLSQHHSAL